jgi:hypothetical protein
MTEVLSWRELVTRAGSAQRACRLLEVDAYRRVLRGWYVPGHVELSAELRGRVLRLALPDDVALCGRTALWAAGVDVLPPTQVLDVAAARGRHLVARPGVRPRSALHADDELVDLPGGLLAMSAPRAFVDVARVEHLVEAVALGDAVLRSGAATREQLEAAVDRAARLRGVVAARTTLPHLEPRSESQGESRLRMQLVLGGLPRPEAQVDYYDARGGHVARIDLVIEGLLLEYDGREQRLRSEVFGADRQRQNRLVDLGGDLRRYTSTDVTPRAAVALCSSVRAALAASAGPSARLHRGPDTLRPPRLLPQPSRADRQRERPAA